jgi:hypothetical protein
MKLNLRYVKSLKIAAKKAAGSSEPTADLLDHPARKSDLRLPTCASSGQISAQSSGRKSRLVTSPPVAASIEAQRSTGTDLVPDAH